MQIQCGFYNLLLWLVLTLFVLVGFFCRTLGPDSSDAKKEHLYKRDPKRWQKKVRSHSSMPRYGFGFAVEGVETTGAGLTQQCIVSGVVGSILLQFRIYFLPPLPPSQTTTLHHHFSSSLLSPLLIYPCQRPFPFVSGCCLH